MYSFYRLLQVVLLWKFSVHGFSTQQQQHLCPFTVLPPRPATSLWSSNHDQAVEALHSLADFHEGRWKGKARSFSVVDDTAAGIIQRKTSPEYEVTVRLGLNEKRDHSITEIFSWDDAKVKARSLAFSESNVDVDSVDASYSLDFQPDLPADITGSDNPCSFAVEHCIAASEDKRMRCFVLYNAEKALERVVLCEETRLKGQEIDQEPTVGGSNQLTARDLIEMQDDADRLVEKITENLKTDNPSRDRTDDPPPVEPPSSSPESLFDKLGQTMATNDGAQKLQVHDVSLLEISSGVWLGDAIIRNNPGAPDTSGSVGRGFSSKGQALPQTSSKQEFGSWSVGVQKVAWRWMWNFEEEIRQVVDTGKAMGDSMAACLSNSLPGRVCVNEGLSRRIQKEDRMVYVDWASNMVGFLAGPCCIQVPRYLSFDKPKANATPFFTEFALFQSAGDGENGRLSEDGVVEENMQLPQLCFSKISRVYNNEGMLNQGVTSFYAFKRFGIDDSEE